ncbi:uncharacterized protein PHACADRAFT_265975 [Phanerochaete carnosa HHB-10118-sp]|uniref:Pentacotripeptide-repeat region of PRORP domain-containing protein n=1 Tax=Phanerochaete carnosa (strain HHB-10118-sp) TaxID=650164 RepID=K5WFH3_PHACS|nr:uncharacterized protein PHACADRAFT_265975 [Phanerochaete carnosa HHB-10118-sp]EKM48927.1 hypothetical protein PHACADRAFT_265975 [Phanerochaete carnosa HHB-10118-sp]
MAKRMKEQGIKPNYATYELLLETCKDAALVTESMAVFEDMLANDIVPQRSAFHHLLYSVRYESIDMVWRVWNLMLANGIQPSEFTYELLILYLTRQGYFELALQKLSEMGDIDLRPTLKTAQSIVILACELGHPRLAVELAESFEHSSVRRLDGVVWVKCLITSSEALYADGVLTSWDQVVRKLKITPDEGCCINVLHTAGRHGLSSLAPDVIKALQSLNVEWAEHHFAPVVEAFCRDGDVKEAFGVLELMRNNDVPPTLETASPIYEVISGSADIVDEAYGMLEDLRNEKRTVDVAAFNVVIQACVALMDLQRALGTYQVAGDLGVTPNIDTYNLLLSACVSAGHRQLGDRLINDMREASVAPDAYTYERLVSLCLTQPTYEDAFYYLEEMKTRGIRPTQLIYESIIRKCFSLGDTRHQLALDEMIEQGYELHGKLRNFLEGNQGKFEPKTKGFAPLKAKVDQRRAAKGNEMQAQDAQKAREAQEQWEDQAQATPP